MANLSEQLRSMDSSYEDEISKYADELKAAAQGNYDFVVKYLKQAHTMALGSSDPAKAQFLEKVSSSLENQIGRIPFDYDQKTTREKEDISNYLKRSAVQRQSLDTQQKQFNEQQAFGVQQEVQQTREASNSRGMLGSGIEEGQLRRLALARKLTQEDPFNAAQGVQRANLNLADAEAQLQSGRNLTDAATTARRDAQNETFNYNQGTEGAGITLNAAKKAADIQASQARQQAISILGQQQAANSAAQASTDYYKKLSASLGI